MINERTLKCNAKTRMRMHTCDLRALKNSGMATVLRRLRPNSSQATVAAEPVVESIGQELKVAHNEAANRRARSTAITVKQMFGGNDEEHAQM